MFYCNKGINIDFFTEEKRLQKESLSQNKKHHMLLPNGIHLQQKLLQKGISKHYMLLPNSYNAVLQPHPRKISKHHMLLPNW